MSENEIKAAPEQTQEATPTAARANNKPKGAEDQLAAVKAAEIAAEAAHRERMRELEAKEKELSILEKQFNVQDVEERLAERQLRREQIRQKAYTNGATLRDIANREAQVQRRCNHRKGGNGAAGITLGQGDNPQHAVIKHTMLTGDMWVRCTRCGKTWKPPIKADYLSGGENEAKGIEGYAAALAEYEAARNFQTNNSPSSSQQFQWGDGGAYAREVLRPTTLR